MREFFCWIKGRKEHTLRTLRSGQAICRPRHPRFSVLSNQSQSSFVFIMRIAEIKISDFCLFPSFVSWTKI